jgi:hypothetical protein
LIVTIAHAAIPLIGACSANPSSIPANAPTTAPIACSLPVTDINTTATISAVTTRANPVSIFTSPTAPRWNRIIAWMISAANSNAAADVNTRHRKYATVAVSEMCPSDVPRQSSQYMPAASATNPANITARTHASILLGWFPSDSFVVLCMSIVTPCPP